MLLHFSNLLLLLHFSNSRKKSSVLYKTMLWEVFVKNSKYGCVETLILENQAQPMLVYMFRKTRKKLRKGEWDR